MGVRSLVRSRPLLAVAAVLLVATAVIVWQTTRLFVWPSAVSNDPDHVDAIVMFGGAGPRFARAAELAEEGRADWLVLSDPRDTGQVWSAYGAYCQQDHPFRVACFDPEPSTTRGEARFTADLARRFGWQRIVLVTSTEQAHRARQLVSRCWDGSVSVVGVPTGKARPLYIAYEWAALTRATVLRRSC